METKRAFVAILLSLAILLGYQYFFVAPTQEEQASAPPVAETTAPEQPAVPQTAPAPAAEAAASVPAPTAEAASWPERPARDIPVETELYRAVVSEAGGGIKSFQLKKYLASQAADAPPMELVTTDGGAELPLFFSWGMEPGRAPVPLFAADSDAIRLTGNDGEESLVLTSRLASGLMITRTMHFRSQDYRIDLDVEVRNASGQPLQGGPYLALINRPFQEEANRFVFTGPAAYIDAKLQQVKPDDLEDGPQSFSGNVSWLAYEDAYFMTGVIPESTTQQTVSMTLADSNKVTSVLSGEPAILPPDGSHEYHYTVYFGPKKLSILKTVGSDLAKIVNFGWLDILAKPTLYLLNILYRYVHNYGIAIILVTVIIKLLFWPIAHKGMKSMKTMQKLQPKMTKLREKYKDDKERLNEEMIRLYQTYKINPLGGCLPMVLQIPVFFALYKVLLQTIELRHAPFMLWITDLSAPDRLYIGFHIPYLGGIPVLTLLMGASMFLQQKMTPTSADPTQAKVMLFLPVIFTFMFLNFASGLVLYWFVNNLLSMLQQHVINRQAEAEG